MEIILYSTNCPKCKILEERLNQKGVKYTLNSDIDKMLELGIRTAPALSVDGKILNFLTSMDYVSSLK